MNNPYKIIYKVKNLNNEYQYYNYIFVSNILDSSIKKILDKIKDIDLFKTFINLSLSEYNILVKFYGDKWYKKFFINDHIQYSVNKINKNKDQYNELLKKFGKKWIVNNIDISNVYNTKKMYNFSKIINIDLEIKNRKFQKNIKVIQNNDEKSNINTSQKGGEDNSNKIEEDELDLSELDSNLKLIEENNIEDININDIEEKVDKKIIKENNILINEIMDTKDNNNKYNYLLDFDTSYNNLEYNIELKNNFKKYYIFNQYIYKDDTIDIIKKKICCSIGLNPIFYNKSKYPILPQMIYLYSKYKYIDPKNNIEKNDNIMIGQKWIKKNSLLNINVIPNKNILNYENLKGDLKILNEDIKKYGNKIKYEDDRFNTLMFYNNYINNNEIYMLDIYNEIGKNYNIESSKINNLYSVYIKIYFFNIDKEELNNIILFINNKKPYYMDNYINLFLSNYNSLKLDNEIMKLTEKLIYKEKYNDYSNENYITQTTIHLNVYDTLNTNNNIDLFRIFDNFIITDEYSFVIYQSIDNNIVYKFSPNFSESKKSIIKKEWFEVNPYGINFKIKHMDYENKYMTINLNEYGRIEYKNQFREADQVKIENIKQTYKYVYKLIEKINNENIFIKINKPLEIDFNFAFINSIQKFIIPKNKIINHNDLSNLVRYFYPYLSLVIEPKKRQPKFTKETKVSKYGTYLRYKRIDKFDNETKIDYRIINLRKNYEHTNKTLSEVISKQFNISFKEALKKVETIKTKFPNIKKSRRILKNLDDIPKYKPPGVGVDIQGKEIDKYKIKIYGARNKEQLIRINNVINVIIYVYIDIFILKNSTYNFIIKKIDLLVNVAKRLNKVITIVNTDIEEKNVKKLIKLDKNRLGFKPEKGQNQWSRLCQNSGNDKKRRPLQYNEIQFKKLINSGYKLNKTNGLYEKKILIGKNQITLRTVKLSNYDKKGNNIYYTCNPKENKSHMFIGFNDKNSNPFGLCMPCCFKKDQFHSKNKKIKNNFLECTNNNKLKENEDIEKKIINEKLYIQQDSNKIHDGKYSYLPKVIDILLNKINKNSIIIKNHYLQECKTGYYLKFGINQYSNNFLNSISNLANIKLDKLIELLIYKINNDKNLLLFSSLKNGDIRNLFQTKEAYINYLQNNEYIDYNLILDLVSSKNILYALGLNIIIFDKIEKNIIINNENKIIIDYTILCNNIENNLNLTNENIKTFLLIKDENYFYPIKFIKFDNKLEINNFFYYINDQNNIIYKLNNFYKLNCITTNIINNNSKINNYNGKLINYKLNKINNNNYIIKYQILDKRYKTIYYILKNNNILFNEQPTGTLLNVALVNDVQKYIIDFDSSLNNYINLNKVLDLDFLPQYFYYDKVDNNKYNIIGFSIFYQSTNYLPIKNKYYTEKELGTLLKSKNINIWQLKKQTDILKLDELLIDKNKNIIFDNRVKDNNLRLFRNESYNIFKLELSNHLNYNKEIKNKIKDIYESSDEKKVGKIKKYLYDIIFNLYDIVEKNNENKLFKLNNYRNICNNYTDKNTCNKNIFCNFNNGKCKPSLKKSEIYKSIIKVSNELVYNELVYKEIMNIDKYFVSNIINKKIYTIRENQKILKSTNIINLNNILKDIFGKKVPKINKLEKKSKDIDDELNININLEKFKNYYLQEIISNSNTIYRSFVTSLYWFKNNLLDIEYKNLGYISNIQTKLANYFKGEIINWLLDINNKKIIEEKLFKYIKINNYNEINNYIFKLNNLEKNNNIIELFILNLISNIPIIVYNNNLSIIYVFDKKIYTDNIDIKKYTDNSKYINFLYEYNNTTKSPSKIKCIYFI